MKFELNWANGLLRPQYERPWLKGQRSTLTFETYL